MRNRNLKIFLLTFLLLSFFFQGGTKAFYVGYKPLFIEVSTKGCFACTLLNPTVKELKEKYGQEVEFLLLDASTEETLKRSQELAVEYGISQFFEESRYAFPTVGIISTNGNLEKVLLGTQSKETYSQILDLLLGIASTKDPSRPEEPANTEIVGGRPEEPVLSERPLEPKFLDRPKETTSSGRPSELEFWLIGQPIPIYAYFNYVILPECSGNNSVLCSSNFGQASKDENVFKPFNPNYTRDEKGSKDAKISKG